MPTLREVIDALPDNALFTYGDLTDAKKEFVRDNIALMECDVVIDNPWSGFSIKRIARLSVYVSVSVPIDIEACLAKKGDKTNANPT